MTTNGFVTNKRRSPMSMGAAFAIQGIILVGLLSMAPEIAQHVKPDGPIIIYTPLEKPVPPPNPVDKPVEQHPVSRVTTIPPVVPTDVATATPFDPTPLLPIPSGPVVGTGTAPFIEPTPAITPKPSIFVDAGVDPRYANGLQPPYPGRLQREQVEGKATVKVLIGTDGRVKTVQLVAADDPGFFKATEEQALKRWRFKPAMRDGVAVESWKQMTVHFRLES